MVRASDFIQACLRLADWVGAGVDVSTSGPARDAVEGDGIGCGIVAPELMWIACVRAGLIEVVGDRAVATSKLPDSDKEWADLGLQLVINLLICMDKEQRAPVLYAVTGLCSPGFGGWAREVLDERWWNSTGNPVGQRSPAADRVASMDSVLLALALLEVLGLLDDVGEDRDEFVPTALGRDVALSVLHLGMQGVFLDVS